MEAIKLTEQDSRYQQLLNLLNDSMFIKLFAEDPHTALEQAGIGLSLADFTAELSKNKTLYDAVVQKISENVDIRQIEMAASSCCSTPTTN